MAQAREQWTSRTGFILAAVGSAVGLGNMWRFSYLTAEGGGAAFVLLYVIFTLLIGLPILLAELAIGRGARHSPIGALAHFGGRAWRPLGLLFVASGFLILSYYSVIAGWTVRYLLAAFSLDWGSDPGSYFGGISQGGPAVIAHVGFMAITVVIVAGGIQRGIERAALVMMPALFLIVAGIAVYAALLDGSGPGYAYYLSPDFSKLGDPELLTAAAGQAFFSLSLGMGAMLTYGSYLQRHNDLPAEATIIAGADFGVALLAGMMVFPLIFALGLEGQVIGTYGTDADIGSVGALFVTLPGAFTQMGPAGQIVGPLFFVALLVGALTSAISLLEVVVASGIDVLGWQRRTTTLIAGGAIALLGVPSALNLAWLDVADTIANNLFLVGGGLGLAVFTGWIMRDPISEAAGTATERALMRLWLPLLRFAVPAALLLVLWYAVPATWSKLVGLLG